MELNADSLQIMPLFSGSSGNAILIQNGKQNILVDAGQNCKKIVEALAKVQLLPEDLSAILITHDHSDHISGLDVFTRKYQVPIYATALTWRGIHAIERKPHAVELDHEIIPGETFNIEEVEVTAFDTPHDAQGSCGYRFSSHERSVAVATDIGFMTPVVLESLKGCEMILLEANYDKDMLWNGEYPYHLKKRIDGNYGHLCNDDCARTVVELYKFGTRHFILGHLSKENNLPQVAERTVLRAMEAEQLLRDRDYVLQIANRYVPTIPISLERNA